MRRELVILLVLCSVFLAIGCADTADEGGADEEVTPAEEGDEEAPEAGEGGANESQVTPDEEPVAPIPEETPELPIGNGETVEVMIEDNAFNPATVDISTGDTVRWTNLDSTPHTVTGTSFGSDTLNPGDSYEFLFTDLGTYDYYCEIHPTMEGTIVVEEE